VGVGGEWLLGAAAGAPGLVGFVLPRIVGELVVVAGAAATGEGRIVLPRIVGELLVIADAAAAGEARIILSRIGGVGADNTAQRLTFGDVELIPRTDDDCPRAKLARS